MSNSRLLLLTVDRPFYNTAGISASSILGSFSYSGGGMKKMVSSLCTRFFEGTLWLQWIAGTAAMIMMFVIGMSVGWSSPYLAQFTSGDSPFPATADEVSWMASVYQLGRLPGAILGAVCVHYFGSKTTMFANSCCLLISWILIIVANSVGWIYASRFTFGANIEIACISSPLFFGDISDSKIRGALLTFALNGLVVGIVAGNAMGAYLSLKLFAGLAVVVSLCLLLVFLLIPNSPYYLMSKGKITDAGKSVLKYNPKADVHVECESIKKYLDISNSMTFVDRLQELNIPRNRKAGLILIALNVFSPCSGINAMTSYLESIMIRGMVTVITPSTVPIIANGIGIIAGWALVYLIEKFGRKTMWVVSSAGLCGATGALGIHFYLIDCGFDPAGMQWLPLFSVFAIKIFYNVGLNCVSAILLSELFAPNIRTLAGCISTLSSGISGFLSIYSYQYFMEQVGEAYAWWIHSIIMLISSIFGLVFVPEMTGKTLLEIQGVLAEE